MDSYPLQYLQCWSSHKMLIMTYNFTWCIFLANCSLFKSLWLNMFMNFWDLSKTQFQMKYMFGSIAIQFFLISSLNLYSFILTLGVTISHDSRHIPSWSNPTEIQLKWIGLHMCTTMIVHSSQLFNGVCSEDLPTRLCLLILYYSNHRSRAMQAVEIQLDYVQF